MGRGKNIYKVLSTMAISSMIMGAFTGMGFANETSTSKSVPISQQAGQNTPPLAGYWNLDEGSGNSANDLSGKGNLGTLENGAAWSTGVVGSHGISLNGKNQYVDVPQSVVDTTQSYTLTAVWSPAFFPSSIFGFTHAETE